MSWFDEARSNFVKNFAYGDAIRHLADRGYTAQRIKREFGYPLSLEEIEGIIETYREEKEP